MNEENVNPAPRRIALKLVKHLKNGASVWDLYESEEAANRALNPTPLSEIVKPKPPKTAGNLVIASDLPRLDPDAGKIVAGEPPLREGYQPEWLNTQIEPFQFIDALFAPDDPLSVSLPEQSPLVSSLSALRKTLGLYGKLCPQVMVDRRSGQTRPRRYQVLRFTERTLDKSWRRISYLSREFPLVMVTLDPAAAALEGWFLVAGKPEEAVKNFFKKAVTLGADPKGAFSQWHARMPNGPAGSNTADKAFLLLKEAGLIKSTVSFNKQKLYAKTLVLFFDAANALEK